MLGLAVEVRPIQVHFRIPYNSLLLDSYPFPPKTTAVGMIAGAMGLPEEGFKELLKNLYYGVIIENPGVKVEETAVIFKNSTSPLYPITKILYYKPYYRLFFAGDEKIIERAYDAILDPVFTLYLGDSESLFYPAKRTYVKIVDVREGNERITKSVVPWEEYKNGASFMVLRRSNLTPREYRVPVNFVYKGKSRRAVYRRVIAFAGGYIKFLHPASVLLFDGEPVFML